MIQVVFLLSALVGAAHSCNLPSHLWCSSREVAERCKVYEQCKRTDWAADVNAPLVKLELYFESLCPDCKEFITHQLFPTYQSIGHIMNLSLIPYGNARETEVGNMWKFECQHGALECEGNMLETCAIHTLGDMKKIMPFIHCMEASSKTPLTAAKACAQSQNVPLGPILSCYNSTLGNQLEHQMALQTGFLDPPHYYVPWIVLNGVHTEKMNNEATSHLLKLICKTYTGPKPAACPQEMKKPSVCARTNFKDL